MHSSFDDSELGFVDMAIGAAKGIGKAFKAIGSAVKKKKAKAKTKKENKVIKVPPTTIEGVVKNGAAVAKQSGAVTPESLTTAIAATLPQTVRTEVLAAIKENNAAKLTKSESIASIASQVDDSIKPQVGALLAALEAQQLSRQATHEHAELSARDSFRNTTSAALTSISTRLDEIAASHNQLVASLKLGNVAIVRKNLPIFGSKNVLEG